MSHRSRRQKHVFECCGRKGFGKFCHFCKDVARGKPVGRKKQAAGARGGTGGEPKYWERAKCPFCGGTRVKKNEINVFSALDAMEFTCMSDTCGKQFNSEHVKEYEKVEVKPRSARPMERVKWQLDIETATPESGNAPAEPPKAEPAPEASPSPAKEGRKGGRRKGGEEA